MEARMKAKNPRSRLTSSCFESLAQKIRPLPDNVVPSAVFQRKMKLRLLMLQSAPNDTAADKAA